MRKKLLFLIIIVLIFGVVAAWLLRPVSVKIFVDRHSILVGEPVEYACVIRYKKHIELELPDIAGALSGFTIISKKISREETLFDKIVDQKYKFTGYTPGENIIPGLNIKYSKNRESVYKEIKTKEIKINIESILPEDFVDEPQKVKIVSGGPVGMGIVSGGTESVREQEGPIRFRIIEKKELRDPVNVKRGIKKAIVFIATVFILILLAGSFYFLRSRKRPEKLSPEERVIKALKALQEKDLSNSGGYKDYCTELQRIIIEYLRAFFGVSAVEMTFEELSDNVLDIRELDYDRKKYLLDLIEATEDIKYSPGIPDQLPPGLQIEDVVRFIEGTNEAKKEGNRNG